MYEYKPLKNINVDLEMDNLPTGYKLHEDESSDDDTMSDEFEEMGEDLQEGYEEIQPAQIRNVKSKKSKKISNEATDSYDFNEHFE